MKKCIDISVPINSDLPVWPGCQEIVIKQNLSLKNGDIANECSINISVHNGTHIDAPSHFINGGLTIEKIPISKLMGPVFVATIKDEETITEVILENSAIPKNVKRLLLHTDNSELWINKKAIFYEDYVALSPGAAKWVVDRNIELIGIDYLSIQKYNDDPDTHVVLLSNNVIILEGLNLRDVSQGWYDLICLPLKFENIEAAPCRAVLCKE